MLVFNNGGGRPSGNYSSVDEIMLPVDAQGNFTRGDGGAFGPREPVWSYTAPKKEDLFAFIMSGANRLPNGNTLICESVSGTIFEVTQKGETVWKYANPAGGSFPMGMPAGPPTLADVLPPMFQFMLNLSPEQKMKLDATQKEVVAKLETILDGSQRKQLLDRRAADPMGFAGMATPGQILPLPAQITLKLSADQKTALAAIQKEVDGKVEALLDNDQKDQMKQMRAMMARGGPPGAAVPADHPQAPADLPVPLVASAAIRCSGPTVTRRTTPAWPARTSPPVRPSRNWNASARRTKRSEPKRETSRFQLSVSSGTTNGARKSAAADPGSFRRTPRPQDRPRRRVLQSTRAASPLHAFEKVDSRRF